jgi:hypothetical protein
MNRRQLLTALAATPFVRQIVSAPPVEAEPEPYSTIDVAEEEIQYFWSGSGWHATTPRFDARMADFTKSEFWIEAPPEATNISCWGDGRLQVSSEGAVRCVYTTTGDASTFTAGMNFS